MKLTNIGQFIQKYVNLLAHFYYLKLAYLNFKAREHEQRVLGDHYKSKIYETFLEGAPQSMLQLYIVLETGIITGLQWATLLSSFFSFTYSATGIFLEYPTKVSMDAKQSLDKSKNLSFRKLIFWVIWESGYNMN